MGKGMKAGKKPGMKKNNQMAQMQQLQAMQRRMEDAQAAIEQMETEASAGGGAVTAEVSGKRKLLSLTIDPEAVDPDDVEMLQDMVVAAVNEAMRKAEAEASANMSKLTGSLNLGSRGGLF